MHNFRSIIFGLDYGFYYPQDSTNITLYIKAIGGVDIATVQITGNPECKNMSHLNNFD